MHPLIWIALAPPLENFIDRREIQLFIVVLRVFTQGYAIRGSARIEWVLE